MEPPSKSIVVKPVKGRLLQREESYTEMFPESPDSEEDQANDDHYDDDDDVVLYLKPKLSDVYNFKAVSPTKPFVPSRNVSPTLQRNVRAWCEATGLPTTITLRFHDRVFHLHKFPLVSRSGYFKKVLKDTKDVTMASDFPSGPEIFELAINFCYGSTILMEPTNIAEIFCAADYLQMSEDYGRANLCERSELYLNQVALQSWDDTLIVLLHSENLALHAEKVGIVQRCLDAIAFMACVEILDPVARKAVPNQTGELQCWSMRESAYLSWWIQDLVALPPGLFVKVVLALRREGMQENYVGQVVTAFADRWIFGAGVDSVMVQKGGDKCWVVEAQARPELGALVESVVRVLPMERHVVPVGFLFGLLRRGLTCALREECRIQIETQIALQFEHATLHDLLLPTKKESSGSLVFRNELDSMERILKLFLSRFRGYDDARVSDMPMLSGVAKLWDEYLAEIAVDSSVTPARFADLVERIPAYMRVVHDHVYRAIHTYLKAHPSTSQEDRSQVCRSLNCQKLSQEACAHAVQNDLMPLRLIVQAMFMQQLQTRSVLTSHIESASQSFREHQHQPQLPQLQFPSASSILHSRSLLPESTSTFYYPSAGHSARHQFGQDSFRSVGSSFRDNDLFIDDLMYAASSQNKADIKVPVVVVPPKAEYAVTETRLRTLEAELSRMRQALSHPTHPTSASTSQSPPPHRPHPRPSLMEDAYCGPTGCLSHLHPVNRTGGLLAKTLQKLRFRSFGKSKGAREREPVISAPIVDTVKRGGVLRGGGGRALPVQVPEPGPGGEEKEGRFEEGRRLVRTDSMPKPFTSHVKPRHHVRHKSIS